MYNISETLNLNETSSIIKRFNLLSRIKDASTMAKLERFMSKRFSTPLRAYSTTRETPCPTTGIVTPHTRNRKSTFTPSLRTSKRIITPHMKASSVIPGIEFEGPVTPVSPLNQTYDQPRNIHIDE